MKRLYFIAAMALATLTTSAQQKLYLSTYSGTNVEKYDGKTYNVTVNRYIFKGWNTIALPFELSAEELNETFGQDCKLERLIGVENEGSSIVLNFQDCKAEGLQANMPYVLYYTGENSSKKIEKEALISYGQPALSFTTSLGEVITMSGVQKETKGIGLYGIPARDNGEVNFQMIDESLNGFYATRCYVQLNSATATKLKARHLAAGEVTSIQSLVRNGEIVDVYSLSGQKIATGISTNNIGQLKQGIYVVNGQKVLVK